MREHVDLAGHRHLHDQLLLLVGQVGERGAVARETRVDLVEGAGVATAAPTSRSPRSRTRTPSCHRPASVRQRFLGSEDLLDDQVERTIALADRPSSRTRACSRRR